MEQGLRDGMRRLTRLAARLDSPDGLDSVLEEFRMSTKSRDTVFNFIRGQALHKRATGKVRTAETYRSALHSLMRFRKGVDLTFGMMDSGMIESLRSG